MNLNEIQELTPECCNTAAIDLNTFDQNEKKSLKKFLPDAKSVIVLGHHIKNSREWIWTQLESEHENSTCIADLHTKDILKNIKNYINSKGHNSKLIPYPGISGVRFKKLAEKTEMGEIGDNFLFLHNQWGPWVHLRVLLTEASINSNQIDSAAEVCIHCGKCIEACPANAITKNGFNSQKCRERHDDLNSSHSCEICARICPIGESPKEIKVV
ncbi:MAG: 4Fe-4S binding protein [bacterium]